MKDLIVGDGKLPTVEELIFYELNNCIQESIEFDRRIDAYCPILLPKQREFFNWIVDPNGNYPEYPINALFLGSLGGGKSRTLIYVMLKICALFPGIKILVARGTVKSLYLSLVQELRQFLWGAGIPFTENQKLQTMVLPGKATLFFYSDDSPENLGSTDYAGVVLEEADGIDEAFFETTIGRRRQPNMPLRFCIAASNPPDKTHWLFKWFVGKGDPTYRVFHAHMDENYFLPPSYVQAVKDSYSYAPALYRRLVEGQWGSVVRGDPVYKGVFSRQFHVAKKSIPFDPALAVNRSWDYGWLTPYALMSQLRPNNQLVFLKGKTQSKVILPDFIDIVFAECNESFSTDTLGGTRYRDFTDPIQGNRKEDLLRKTRHDIMRDKGIHPSCVYTSVAARIDAAERRLAKQIMGEPAILISPDPSLELLIEALESGYVRGDDGDPVRDAIYEHPADCFGYTITNLFTTPKHKRGAGEHKEAKAPGYNLHKKVKAAPPMISGIRINPSKGYRDSSSGIKTYTNSELIKLKRLGVL